jgi:DNA-binding MarR family transcriptional regulator
VKTRIPDDIQKLADLIDAIQILRLSKKAYIQNKLREHKFTITYEMFQVLGVLWKTDGVNQQEIADKVQKNKASLTSLIDNLVKRKLVLRSEDPNDRRNKIISLTRQGHKSCETLQVVLDEFYELVKSDISGSQIESVTKMLYKLNKNITF